MQYRHLTHQAITTDYRVDRNGNSYIFAKCRAKKIRRPFDSNLNLTNNCYQVAVELCQLLEWPTDLIGGSLPGPRFTQVWVHLPQVA